MTKEELAVEYKRGCNCCQAVLLAYAEEIGLPEETLRALGAAFGSGMGGMQGDCGALVGAEMVLGLLRFQGAPLHAAAKQLFAEFRERTGGVACAALKGVETGKPLCSCENCVRYAVRALENRISD